MRLREIYGIILQKIFLATREENNMAGETIKIEFEMPKELFLKGRNLTQTSLAALPKDKLPSA